MEPHETDNSAPVKRFLRSLGFIDGRNEAGFPSLVINIAGYQIWASEGVDRYLRPIILLSGIVSTGRTIASVECAMPVEMESRELALAWLSWTLRDAFPESTSTPSWLQEGRTYWHLLPWEKGRTEYAARPSCFAQRDWAKAAIKSLNAHLDRLPDDHEIAFGFDGKLLRIECGDELIAFPACGKAWPCAYGLRAQSLRSAMPKRLPEIVHFSVWEDRLLFGNKYYSGVIALNQPQHSGEQP